MAGTDQPTYDPTNGDMPGNAGYNWSGFNTISLSLIVKYSANGYNGAAAENPPPSDSRQYNGSPGTQSQHPSFTLGVTVSSGETMSNPGYVFVGWATSNNTQTVSYNPGDRLTHTWAWGNVGTYSTTLYAVWTNENVISYHPDSNSDEKSTIYQVKEAGQAATLKGETFHRTGYTQTGWATTEGGPKVYNLGATYSSSAALDLYPVWTANTYTINFNANGGTGTMSSQTVTFGSTFTLSSCSFTREGYSFSSWNEDPDGKSLRWPVQEYTVTRAENISLFAIWKGNEYYVRYDDNANNLSEELTGNYISFNTDYAQDLAEMSVALEPIQNGTPWTDSEHDKVPYNFRAVSDTTASRVGNSELGSIVGGTVGWNQLVPLDADGWAKYRMALTISDHKITFAPSGNYSSLKNAQLPLTKGHKYFVFGKMIHAESNFGFSYGLYYGAINSNTYDSRTALTYASDNPNDVDLFFAMNPTRDDNVFRISLATAASSPSYYATIDNLQLFDLTAMFGSAVADYLYTLESGTAGAGVAYFRKLFPKSYYAYDSGSLQSVNTSAHKTYKADTTLLGNYALDSSLTLRGIPKLDANNNLYYDGDVYEASGTVTRKYRIVDLGTLTWTKSSGEFRSSALSQGPRIPTSQSQSAGSWVRCVEYDILPSSASGGVGVHQGYTGIAINTDGRIWGRNDAFGDTTASQYTTLMSGIYLVYELATPTTETATAYAATQSIDPDGTEEYVDYAESQGTRDVAIPVGHDTIYANNCPISGWVSVSSYHTGKNIWYEAIADWKLGYLISSSGTEDENSSYKYCQTYFPVKESTQYAFQAVKGSSASAAFTIIYYDENKTFLSRYIAASAGASTGLKTARFTTPSGCSYIRMNTPKTSTSNIQIEEGSVSTNYEDSGKTYLVDWTSSAGTVYRGTVDIITGLLTVEKQILDLGGLSWTKYDSSTAAAGYAFYASVSGKKVKDTGMMCSRYWSSDIAGIAETYAAYGINDKLCFSPSTANSARVYIADSDYSTSADLTISLNGVQLVYTLDTPIVYSLTPEEVKAFIGSNSIWTDIDTNSISLRYKLNEGAEGSMAPSTAVYGDLFYTRRNAFKRFGVTFKGWNTARDGSGEEWLPSRVSMDTFKRTEDAIWNLSQNITLYAQWDPFVYPYGKVFFNGKYSTDYGIVVEELPSYFYPERPFNHKAVNGKNGDALLDPARYENVKKVYKLACYDPNKTFYESAVALSTWLHSSGSDYLRLEDSYEPSSYRMAVYEEANEIDNIEGIAGKVEVTFSCMPQRFLTSGDDVVHIPSSGSIIQNPTEFNAKPLIRVEGTGNITVNGRTIEIYYNYNELDIDCEKNSAKDLAGVDMNSYIYCDEFPVLGPGINVIYFEDTITSVDIVPRWWIL